MSEVSWHVLYLGLEVGLVLMVLAALDGLIGLLSTLVRRGQRKRDHEAFVRKFRRADPFAYDEMPRDADQIVIEARKGRR